MYFKPQNQIILGYPLLYALCCSFCFMACTPKETNQNTVGKSMATNTTADQSNTLSITDYCDNCNTCACTGTGTGKDYSNQTLTKVNFYANGDDLTAANFSGATLVGCVFDNLNLSDVNFSGATFLPDSFGTQTSFQGATLDQVCFSKANLSKVNFQFSIFKNADFTCANISNAEFGPVMTFQGDTSSRTKFNYAQVSMSEAIYLFPLNNFAAADWSKTDFSYTRFNGLTNANFKPKNKDLSYAKLRGINLASYDMRNCTLTRADLSYATLDYAQLDSAHCYGADFSYSSFMQTAMVGTDFYSTNYPGTSFLSATMNGANLNQSDLQHAIFTGANMGGAQIKGANLQHCNMEGGNGHPTTSLNGANLSGSDLSYAALDDVVFQNNFLIGTKFQYLDLTETQFANLVMTGADFYNSTMQEVNFNNSKLHNAIFKSCTFSSIPNGNGVLFTCTELGGADFSNAVVNMADFSYAVIPPDTSCCIQKDSSYNCGVDSWTGQTYGATILPTLTVPVRCPDGKSTAICSGSQWQIPNWQTSMCNPDNKEEIVWVAPDCSGKHKDSTGIQIKDPNLKQCIADQFFNGDTTQIITAALAATVTALDCGNRGIKDISGLDSFPNLETLDLTANALTQDQFNNLSPNLVTLKLAYNDLTSISLGSQQSFVAYLDASNNQITTINIAEKYLNYLDLSHNQLSGDMSSFAEYPDLTYLNLSYNKLTSVGNLSGISGLGNLFLENNQLETIGNMGALWDCGTGVLYTINLQNNDCFECNTLDPSSSCNEYDIVALSYCACEKSCSNCDESNPQ